MLVSLKKVLDGSQAMFRFDNGYGASVVRHRGAYCDLREGHDSGTQTFEVAVTRYEDSDGSWAITYETTITGAVLGWQTAEEVAEILRQIGELT